MQYRFRPKNPDTVDQQFVFCISGDYLLIVLISEKIVKPLNAPDLLLLAAVRERQWGDDILHSRCSYSVMVLTSCSNKEFINVLAYSVTAMDSLASTSFPLCALYFPTSLIASKALTTCLYQPFCRLRTQSRLLCVSLLNEQRWQAAYQT